MTHPNTLRLKILSEIFLSRLKKIYFLIGKTYLRKYLPLAEMTIETTSICNLNCRGCYRTNHDYSSKNKQMSLLDFKNYLSQLPKVYSLNLHGLGEPTLNPHLIEIIKSAKESNKFKIIK